LHHTRPEVKDFGETNWHLNPPLNISLSAGKPQKD
jgi:hypothetical protein